MPKIIATEDWIKLGLKLFAEGGPEALVVEKLAKQLGSSKTSFYWYFKTRAAFIKRIIASWQELATASIIAHLQEQESVSPREKIYYLLRVMFSTVEGHDFIYHLRNLGVSEPEYADILQTIEKQRLDYLTSLLMNYGQSYENAASKSELVYSYYLGWHERHKHKPPSDGEAEKQIALLKPFLESSI
ncbi:AcrR family transcriptional regulator [Paenibacillus endophyticus]|uniref:AcrR family transcriptional regulator n=1 Tax=Paenibacillus endophyticus TaxID=1294268 RepID=A0A7W5CA48_9BACL|nr:TetR/AcrR family transcriptional regulator [Paenibacillus endophyticus]MBB3152944.1 AcrR family transcriptional regulator [Paenibacillus endophyticus]